MVSIIIPFYFADTSQYKTISRCFDSLKESGFDGELIVVNDASPIETSDFPMTIKHPVNLGYTRSVNDGLKLATGDVLVVANQDIVFTKELVESFNKIHFGIYSPKTTDEGEGDKFGSIWGMSRRVYTLLGELDERLKHYFSDSDYYRRAKETGVPVVKWRGLMIEHEGSNAYDHVDKGHCYNNDLNEYAYKWGDLK